MAAPIVFKGISFPFRKGALSFPARASNEELIKESLLQLVLTQNGERIMRPEVGSNALSFIFEPNNEVLAATLRAEIQGVVAKYEPRILLRDIRTLRRDSELILTIDYVILASGAIGSVTFGVPTPT